MPSWRTRAREPSGSRRTTDDRRASEAGATGWFGPDGYDRVYFRRYVRFAEDYGQGNGENRVGGRLSAVAGNDRYVGMDYRGPAWEDKFDTYFTVSQRTDRHPAPGVLTGLETWCVYMIHGRNGRGWGQGIYLHEGMTLRRAHWYCLEHMTKANDPGKANGELAVWINGKLCSHQKGIRFRPTADVKLKRFNIGVFVSQALRDNIVWYDDLALSTGYIGPMKEGSATPMPPLPEPQLSTEYIGPRKEAAAQAGERGYSPKVANGEGPSFARLHGRGWLPSAAEDDAADSARKRESWKQWRRKMAADLYGGDESVSVAGTVTDEAGKPLRTATVGIGPYGLLPFQWNCETDEAGRFRFGFQSSYWITVGMPQTSHAAGTQSFSFRGPVRVPADSLVVGADGYAATRIPFSPPPGKYNMAIRLRKGMTVRARVADGDGRPVQNAFVLFVARIPDSPKWVVQHQGNSDAEGRVAWTGACAGRGNLRREGGVSRWRRLP